MKAKELYNEKAKAARAAYNKENIRTLATTVRKDHAEQFKAYAKSNNTTVGALLKAYVMDILGREERGNGPVELPLPGSSTRPQQKGTELPLYGNTYGAQYQFHPCAALLTNKNMDRLKRETAFYNPRNYNPDQMLNHILDNYFKMADEIRTKG